MHITQFVTDALGDSSYLLVTGGEAAVIDPQRDVRPYVDAAERAGAHITSVFETHVHNDYISGGPELAARGATIHAPAEARLAFPHTPVEDGDEVPVGDVRLRAMAAPGHTYEHTVYIAVDTTGEIQGIFTGGALLMASVGRSDLLGAEHTENLTRLQWETAQRIRAVAPVSAEILPTHGAGSFCSVSRAPMERRAPLAAELERNPALTSPSYEVFREIQLATTAPTPAYYERMSPINRAGARVFGEPPRPALLDAAGLRALDEQGIRVVDVRPRDEFIRGHVPASIEIEESGSLLAYASWLLPFNSPLALVTIDTPQAERVTVDFFRIGYEDVRGYLPFDAWVEAAGRVETLETVSAADVAQLLESGRSPVIDVRYGYEQESSPLPGALRLPIDRLPQWADEAPKGTVVLSCGSGQRSTMAASILARRGHHAVALANGGADDILAALRKLAGS